MSASKNGGKNGNPTKQTEPTASSLDQVREILFGEQARSVEDQLGRLEKRISKEFSALQADISKRFEAAEKANAARVEALRVAIERETEARVDSAKDLSVDLDRSSSELSAKLDSADQNLRASLTALDQAVAKHRESLSNDIQGLADASKAALSAASDELQDRKADRADLAVMFSEIAERLSGGPRKKG